MSLNPSTPRAGELDLNLEYKAKLVVRKGDINDNPRGGIDTTLRFVTSEGFLVFKAKVTTFKETHQSLRTAQLIDDQVYFRWTKGGSQSQIVPLTIENFHSNLLYRWSKISTNDVSNFTEGNGTVRSRFQFEVFIYIHKPTRNEGGAVPTILRRATANRVAAAGQAVQQWMNSSEGTQLGEITRNHVEIAHARRPEGVPFQMPTDNTTRQAQALDAAHERIQQRQQAREANDARETIKIEIKIQNHWHEVEVNLASLRTGLGLPPYNMFNRGIFHGYQHPTVAAEDDIADVDHADVNNDPTGGNAEAEGDGDGIDETVLAGNI